VILFDAEVVKPVAQEPKERRVYRRREKSEKSEYAAGVSRDEVATTNGHRTQCPSGCMLYVRFILCYCEEALIWTLLDGCQKPGVSFQRGSDEASFNIAIATALINLVKSSVSSHVHLHTSQ
jgi:hypothetical protein